MVFVYLYVIIKYILHEEKTVEYRKYGDAYYVRMDRDDEIIDGIFTLCKKENIASCTFSGIGGCGHATIQTFLPKTGTFETREIAGLLELVSLTGNVVMDGNGTRYHHTHAVFAYKDGEEHQIAAGHIKDITVSYTAEIVVKPVPGVIGRTFDPETGTGFWNFTSLKK